PRHHASRHKLMSAATMASLYCPPRGAATVHDTESPSSENRPGSARHVPQRRSHASPYTKDRPSLTGLIERATRVPSRRKTVHPAKHFKKSLALTGNTR